MRSVLEAWLARQSAPVHRSVACAASDIAPGEMRRFRIGKVDILVARKDATTFYAVRSICPHQGADLSAGYLVGTNLPSPVGKFRYGREGEIVRCPWHAWEFDLTTGSSLHDPNHQRVKAYRAYLEGDSVVIEQ
jgi:nitrite reductase/ring-hydroxylating ferredoxin subunit